MPRERERERESWRRDGKVWKLKKEERMLVCVSCLLVSSSLARLGGKDTTTAFHRGGRLSTQASRSIHEGGRTKESSSEGDREKTGPFLLLLLPPFHSLFLLFGRGRSSSRKGGRKGGLSWGGAREGGGSACGVWLK